MSGAIVDDADAAVVYSGSWYASSGLSTVYKGTTHISNTRNDQATLTFQGIGVVVNGQMAGWRVRSSYSIDGGSPTVYSNDSYQSTIEAYRSATLSNGKHTLTVINLDDRDVSFFLDSFIVLTLDDTVSTPSSSSSSFTTASLTRATTSTSVSSNSTTAHSGTTTSTASAGFLATTNTRSSASRTPDSSSTPSPTSTKSKDPSQILLIVAPAFGAVVICVIIFFLLRRRRKRKEPDSEITSPTSNDPIRFPPAMLRANGQKPSSFMHNSSEPPPYVQDLQHTSHSLIQNRQPTKFRAG